MQNPGASRREIADVCLDQGAYVTNVIACDKREALAQGSATDEAIHSFLLLDGLLSWRSR